MSAKITVLLDIKKELRKNFAGLEINCVPSEQHPESIEVWKKAWGETIIHINVYLECISIFGTAGGKSDACARLPSEAQDCLNQIKTILEPSIPVMVHGPATAVWS